MGESQPRVAEDLISRKKAQKAQERVAGFLRFLCLFAAIRFGRASEVAVPRVRQSVVRTLTRGARDEHFDRVE